MAWPDVRSFPLMGFTEMARRKLTEFGKLRRRYFLSQKDAARQFEVTTRTIRNWDYRSAPRYALRALQRQDRQLGGIHPDWCGFRIGWNGWLYGPERIRIKAETLKRQALSARLGPKT